MLMLIGGIILLFLFFVGWACLRAGALCDRDIEELRKKRVFKIR